MSMSSTWPSMSSIEKVLLTKSGQTLSERDLSFTSADKMCLGWLLSSFRVELDGPSIETTVS